MNPELTEILPSTLGWGTFFHILSVLILCAHLLNKPRDSRTSLLWIFLAAIFPVFGVSAYVLFGINTSPDKGWEKQHSDSRFNEILINFREPANPLKKSTPDKNEHLTQPRLKNLQLLNQMVDHIGSYHPLLGGNSLELLDDPTNAINAMFDSIKRAQHHIHLSTYILADDEIGKQLMQILVERAKNGVTIRVMYDAFGSAATSLRLFFWSFRKVANLKIIGFSQVNILKRKFQLNNRNHRKLLIIDGVTAYTGGINFHNVYLKKKKKDGSRDYHFKVKGPIVLELQYTFLRDWFYMVEEPAEKLLSAALFPEPQRAGECAIRVSNSGPTQDEKAVAQDALFATTTRAQKQLLILTPYFVPSQSLILALRMAALRGVDVRVLVPSVNNHPTLQQASHALYDILLLSGVRIFEREPPFIHSKAVIIDDEAAIIGSANVDPRSLYLNYETNLIVFDNEFASTLKRAMQEEFDHSVEITHLNWNKRPKWKKLIENFFNLFHPIA